MMKKLSLFTALLISCIILFAQWESLNGPVGGYVRSIAFDGETIYAATGGGVLASDDGGTTWEFRNSGLGSCDTKSLCVIEPWVLVSTDENVFRTANNGNTWEPAGNELAGKYVKHMLVVDGFVFAATYLRGIWKSPDMGVSWEPANNGFPAKYAYYLASDGIYIYCGTYQEGIYRSADLGDSWESINNGLSEPDIMAIHCFDDKVFISTLNSGVFVSENNGNTWAPTGTSLPSVKGFTDMNGILYAVSMGNGVYVSPDSGISWSQINNGLTEPNLWAIGHNGSNVFAGSKEGHLHMLNSSGTFWSLSCNEPFLACVGSLSISGPNLLAGTHGSGFFASPDGGMDWVRITSIWTVETRGLLASPPYVFAGTDMLGIFRSTVNGGTFSMANTGLTSAWIQSFALCQGRLFAGSGEEGIFRSDDTGLSWSHIASGPGSDHILSMVSDGARVYAGTEYDGVYVSNDLGDNWEKLGDGLDENMILSLGISGSTILAGTYSSGMYLSPDNGNSWEQVMNGMPADARVNAIITYDTMAIAGCSDGKVRVSHDNGFSWIHLGDDLPGMSVLSVWTEADYIYAGLNAGGVWRCPAGIITGYRSHDPAPSLFITPNPASSRIRIIGGPGNGLITVIDQSGSVVYHKQSMEDEALIDVSGWVPGTYVVTAGGGSSNRSALLVVQ